MKIYTKGGDAGETGLFGGARVPKDHLRIESYGALDELNSVIGLAIGENQLSAGLRSSLMRVQNELFQLGAELATPEGKKTSSPLLDEVSIELLERQIDRMEEELEPLKNFILPGGARTAGLLHLARTVCRRSERAMVTLSRQEKIREIALKYINRLSDFLFVAARYENRLQKIEDIPWRSNARK